MTEFRIGFLSNISLDNGTYVSCSCLLQGASVEKCIFVMEGKAHHIFFLCPERFPSLTVLCYLLFALPFWFLSCHFSRQEKCPGQARSCQCHCEQSSACRGGWWTVHFSRTAACSTAVPAESCTCLLGCRQSSSFSKVLLGKLPVMWGAVHASSATENSVCAALSMEVMTSNPHSVK